MCAQKEEVIGEDIKSEQGCGRAGNLKKREQERMERTEQKNLRI